MRAARARKVSNPVRAARVRKVSNPVRRGRGQEGQQPGEGRAEQEQPRSGGPGQGGRGGNDQWGGFRNFMNDGNEAEGELRGPLTGDNYVDWSDRLRDVEEMLDDPELRQQVARIRGRARTVRADFKRHGKEPQWDLVQTDIYKPLVQLRDAVIEELARRSSDESLTPIDRDPVPPKYAEKVRRYYEELGSAERKAPAP